jgi:archaellum component FlaC
MENKGNNKLKMYKTVQSVCASNQAVWNAVPAFVTAYDRFTIKVTELDQLVFAQGTGTIGVKKVKDKEHEETANRAHKVASALRALATDTSNTVLLAQLHFSHSDLLHGSNASVIQLMTRVKDAAISEVMALAAYGIMQAHIDDLVARIEQLSVTFGSTRNAIVDRGKTTKLIKEAIREIDQILKMSLDQLVEVLKEDNHDFALSYEKAREVVDLHGKKHKSGNDDQA